MVTTADSLAAVKLLVLDDDAAVGKTISLMAKRLGAECRCTTQADVFFKQFRDWRPTHITLDLAMPELDGIEALRHLAQIGCDATIILVSGVDSRVLDAAHRAAKNHGLSIAGTIPKPFSLSALRDLLTVERDIFEFDFAEATEEKAEPRLTRTMLAKAMAAGQIDVAFQPKVTCRDTNLVGFEALARWTHPKYGPISPERFIPLSERTGQCRALTEGIFDASLAWFAELGRPELTLALNLSATLLDDVDLADRLSDMCQSRGVDEDRVTLEITESSRIYDETAALDLLVRLRLKGFSLSIDDFGVGYSSLSQLARIPFSELKIDRSFVTTIAHSLESRNIVTAIVRLAHSLGLGTVAEGVEDLTTFRFLSDIGCHQVQGYLIGRPMTCEAVTDWMAPLDTEPSVERMPERKYAEASA
jgi:EAL domain-containing protein (putative c-di-GMP-specific phosphodiesterase class I)/FixJ family two-component response regulator